jgi:hypothetical protein
VEKGNEWRNEGKGEGGQWRRQTGNVGRKGGKVEREREGNKGERRKEESKGGEKRGGKEGRGTNVIVTGKANGREGKQRPGGEGKASVHHERSAYEVEKVSIEERKRKVEARKEEQRVQRKKKRTSSALRTVK